MTINDYFEPFIQKAAVDMQLLNITIWGNKNTCNSIRENLIEEDYVFSCRCTQNECNIGLFGRIRGAEVKLRHSRQDNFENENLPDNFVMITGIKINPYVEIIVDRLDITNIMVGYGPNTK